MNNTNLFPARLKALRKQRGIPQYKLSHLCGLGDNAIRRYEAGERIPNQKALENIAEYFDVSIDYLVGRTDNKKSHKLSF